MKTKLITVIALMAFLSQSYPVFAQHRDMQSDRRDFRPRMSEHSHDFHSGMIAHRLPPGYCSIMYGALSFLYCEGLFYRYSPSGYVVVQPPAGAIVPSLPPGYTTVLFGGIPYYYYGYTYYVATPNGYMVATPPQQLAVPSQPTVPLVAPQAVAPAAPVTQSVIVQQPQQPTANAPTTEKTESEDADTFDIHIPNANGSFTLITLKKTEKGFLGPQGEFYEDHPTVEELEKRYVKK